MEQKAYEHICDLQEMEPSDELEEYVSSLHNAHIGTSLEDLVITKNLSPHFQVHGDSRNYTPVVKAKRKATSKKFEIVETSEAFKRVCYQDYGFNL